MERSTWIGIALVAALGIGGALVAFVSIAPPTRTTEPLAAVPDAPREPAADEPSGREPRATRPTAPEPPSPAEVGRPPGQDPDPRPRAPIPSGPLDETFLRGEELLARPIGADLPPDASEAEIVEAVAERIADVEELVAEYREIARTDSDPNLRGEALQRGAMLYDRLAEQVPTAPPPYVDEAGMDAWVRRNEEMVRNLHEKAEAMRQDATLTLEEP